MIQLKNVSKTFNANTINEKKALVDLNLTIETGDFVTVIGGNGAGKSTLLNLIAGVFPCDGGRIMTPLVIAGAFYLVMNGVVTRCFTMAEARLDYYR